MATMQCSDLITGMQYFRPSASIHIRRLYSQLSRLMILIWIALLQRLCWLTTLSCDFDTDISIQMVNGIAEGMAILTIEYLTTNCGQFSWWRITMDRFSSSGLVVDWTGIYRGRLHLLFNQSMTHRPRGLLRSLSFASGMAFVSAIRHSFYCCCHYMKGTKGSEI